MSSLLNKQIPPPESWEEFEKMCCDLWRLLWNDPNAQKHGRRGQAQAGVDIFGQPDEGNEWAGVQCKGKDNYANKTLTKNEVREEVNKAKGFKPRLTQFIIATTGPIDRHVQGVARQLTEENQQQDLFSVHIRFWEDIKNKLAECPELIKKYYPDFYATTVGSDQIDRMEQMLEKLTARSASETSNAGIDILQLIEQYRGPLREIIVAEALTSEYEKDLNYARDLIKEYKPREALNFLNHLRGRIWSSADSKTRYRIITYIGSAKIHLDNIREGAECLIKALQYNREDEDAILNAGFGHYFLNERDKAEQLVLKVLERNSASSRAYSILVQINDDKPYKTVLDRVPEAYRNAPEVAHALGLLAENRRKLEEAKEWFERGIKSEPEDDIELKTALGFILVEMLSDRKESIDVGQLDDNTQSMIDRVIKLFTEGWEKVKDTDLKSIKHSWIAQRGIMFRLEKDYKQAAKDLDMAIELCPDNPIYKRFRAFVAYEFGDTQRATTLLNELINSPEQIKVVILLAEIYWKTGRPDDAIKILTDCIEQHPDHNLIGEVKRSLVYTYLRTDNLDKAENLVNEMRDEEPKNILHLVVAAEILARGNQHSDALSLLNEAKAYALKRGSIREQSSVARELQKLGQYQEAAELYEKIADRTKYTPLTHDLLVCYYESGKLNQALEICQNIIQKGDMPRKIIDMATVIYSELGNFLEGRNLCERYLEIRPDDEQMRLRKAIFGCRIQDSDEVNKYLQSDIDTSKLILTDIFDLAGIYGRRGYGRKAIELLYETLRTHYDNGKAHQIYVSACLCFTDERDNNEWFYPVQADVDTAICVEDESGRKKWYVIEDRDDVKIDRQEISPTHTLAQQLLGKSVGEEIILRDNPMGTEKGTIVGIRSKYAHACHDSIENVETRFPDNPGMHQLTIQGLDSDNQEYVRQQFDSILRPVREQGQQVDQYIHLYKEGRLTIGALAQRLNRHPLNVWGGLMYEEKIHCCRNDVQELNAALKLLKNGNITLVIDLISIMTIYDFKVHNIVVETFGKLGIAQSTIDDIQQKIYELRGMLSQGFMTMGHRESQYVRQEITADQVREDREYLEKLVEWIRQNCDIFSVSAAGNMDREKRKRLEEFLGKSFADTILIASESGKVLWSDDLMLRIIGENLYNADGVWTQTVLKICTENGQLEEDEYIKAVIHLVTANYHHTSVDADTVIEAARQSDWIHDFPLTQVLKILSGKYSDEDSAIAIAVEFVYRLWQAPIIRQKRDALIIAVLNTITEGRNRPQALNRFMIGIQQRFNRPLTSLEIVSIVEAWQERHTL